MPLEGRVERIERVENQLDRVEAALVRLAEAQARTEERIERLTEQVQALVSWQRGAARPQPVPWWSWRSHRSARGATSLDCMAAGHAGRGYLTSDSRSFPR